MSTVTENAPDGTPTWIDLGIPDLERAMDFYGPLFGWEFDVGPAETGRYTTCLLRGEPVAAMMPNPDPSADPVLVERLPGHRRLRPHRGADHGGGRHPARRADGRHGAAAGWPSRGIRRAPSSGCGRGASTSARGS